MRRVAAALMFVLAVSSCASKPVRMEEARRIVGTENRVRVDAEVFVDATLSTVTLKYDVTNGRSSLIAVADIVPETSWDPQSRTVTVSLGSEVPGENLLPRLIGLKPGEKRSFTAGAAIGGLVRRDGFGAAPAELRIRLNFLGDTTPFASLVDIPEKAVHDPELADKLFLQWIELNETVETNAVPLRSDAVTLPAGPDPTARRR